MQDLKIIKIGGNVIDHEEKLQAFLRDFAQLPGLKVLVHGGGKLASDLSRTLGIAPQLVEGRRITDEATLRVVTMVYAGLINKNLVARLQAHGTNALGLTGADANIIPATKRQAGAIDYGFAGDINTEELSGDPLARFLEQGLTPVVAPITHNGQGQLLNTNADTIASSLAVALSRHFSVQLVYCFEKAGVLLDVNDEDTLIPHLTPAEYGRLKEQGVIAAGMVPKLDNAYAAIRAGVTSVRICHADALKRLAAGEEQAGTVLSEN
jgi:acetylglutamate kinase